MDVTDDACHPGIASSYNSAIAIRLYQSQMRFVIDYLKKGGLSNEEVQQRLG